MRYIARQFSEIEEFISSKKPEQGGLPPLCKTGKADGGKSVRGLKGVVSLFLRQRARLIFSQVTEADMTIIGPDTMTKRFAFTFLLLLCWTLTVQAQFDFTPNDPDGTRHSGGPRLGKSQTQIYRAGIILEPGLALDNVEISVPVPMQWREQRIISVNEETMDAGLASRIRYQVINGGIQEMYIPLGSVMPTKPLEIVVAFELENYELLPPDNPSQYVIPKQVPMEIQQYLRESPCIERDPKFVKLFAEITKERRTDWDKVEALYSFVQNNVKYNDKAWKEPAKGALSVIKMPKGEWTADCKDMTCLFVALCRAGKIPARVVRVPQHCYAEFYLELKQESRPGQGRANNGRTMGYWFPCQVSGMYAFGGIPEKRVILQKGDSFPDPANPMAKTLFPAEVFQGTKSPGTPAVQYRWVHDVVVK